MERQQRNAGLVAAWLEAHPAVSAVHYPGLAAHPGHAIARAQQQGFGALMSFDLAGGAPAAARQVEELTVFTLAESLGRAVSRVAHPATTKHADMDAEARRVRAVERHHGTKCVRNGRSEVSP